MRNSNMAKGYSTIVLDNCQLAKNILKGSANRESTTPKLDRAIVTIKLMKILKVSTEVPSSAGGKQDGLVHHQGHKA